jgi:hypothetical protein
MLAGRQPDKTDAACRCDIVSLQTPAYISRAMPAVFANPGQLDRWAIGLSGLCLVHCVATAIFVGIVASVGGVLGHPVFHEVGLMMAMVLGAAALGRGVFDHGFLLPLAVGLLGLAVMAGALSLHESGSEPIVTGAGVSILALAHRLNFLAAE